jgi:adenylate cyclase
MRIVGTFAFVDMAGFTALTEAQGDEDAADVATMFAEITRAALGPGDRLVKTIGDAVLVTSKNAAAGLALIERLLTEAAAEPRLPTLRAGLHHGDAVEREGDVFGAAVNLAARVAAEAHPAEVLGTEPIAEAARDMGIPVIDIGEVALKNVRHTTFLYSMALMLGTMDTPIDPVCRTPIDRRTAAGRLRYMNREYWFCSLTCAAAFASNPEWHRNESMRPSRSPG